MNIAHMNQTSKMYSIFDLLSDSRSCRDTKVDQNDCFIIPKKLKLLQCHEGVSEFPPSKHYLELFR